METGKTEKPPADITKRKFQPAKEIFKKDELQFTDSIKSVWIKFQITNDRSSDTIIALRFQQGVAKAVLYRAEGDNLILVGKTGFFIAVLKRNISYEDTRIDLVLKAHTTTNYFLQVILFHGIWLPKMPVLETFAHAELNAFSREKEINRRNLLWNHFFNGVFFMFFVFGLIKYLVFGKDKAYLYYALLGLTSALMCVAQAEQEINTYFSAFDHIILKFGLEKIKTIGDAYIAAGGLPEKNSATVQNVVEAATAMQREVERLKQERIASNKPYFELRIGIHTGPVVAGVVGIKKFQYDIWGDTVNLAARMEQSGIPGKINISQHTYEAVKDQFTCIHRGKIEAKNKGEMDMYFVEITD